MSDQLRESLSAMLDDAADEFELRRVLDEMSRNDALRDKFARYQLIKSTLRGEASAETLKHRVQLQRRVREAFEDVPDAPVVEDDPVEEMTDTPRRGAVPGMRALAAAAGFVAVIGLYLTLDGTAPEPVRPGLDPGLVAAPPAVETSVVTSGGQNGIVSVPQDEYLPGHDRMPGPDDVPDEQTRARHDVLLRAHFGASGNATSIREAIWMDRIHHANHASGP